MLQFKSNINWSYAAPSKPWLKFFARFSEILALPIPEWKEVHCVGYFACKYQELYGRQFGFSFSGPPSRCQEIILFRKILAALGGNNLSKYVDYVNWIFDVKLTKSKTQIRSLSFLLTDGLINEFLGQTRISQKTYSRTTVLPEKTITLADAYNLSIHTYGDLAFLQQYAIKNQSTEYDLFFQELSQQGFNLEVLKTIV